MQPKIKSVLLLITCILLPQIAGFIGSAFTINSIPTWYKGLEKPFFSPPNWIFAPVWTTLYLLMGISLFMIIRKQKEIFSKPVKIFLIHLAVNSFWSIAFFGMKNPGFAYIIIVILWYMILYLIRSFSKIERRASILLYPYLAWVTFASFLNLSVWLLNR